MRALHPGRAARVPGFSRYGVAHGGPVTAGERGPPVFRGACASVRGPARPETVATAAAPGWWVPGGLPCVGNETYLLDEIYTRGVRFGEGRSSGPRAALPRRARRTGQKATSEQE